MQTLPSGAELDSGSHAASRAVSRHFKRAPLQKPCNTALLAGITAKCPCLRPHRLRSLLGLPTHCTYPRCAARGASSHAKSCLKDALPLQQSGLPREGAGGWPHLAEVAVLVVLLLVLARLGCSMASAVELGARWQSLHAALEAGSSLRVHGVVPRIVAAELTRHFVCAACQGQRVGV